MISSSCTRLSRSSCSKPLRELSHRASRTPSRALNGSPLDSFHSNPSQLLFRPVITCSKLHATHVRAVHSTSFLTSPPPRSRDRGPASKESTQTDFASLDVLGKMPVPATAIEACHSDGFLLNSGLRISGGGALLVGGEAFTWRPWEAIGGKKEKWKVKKLLNGKGQWDVPPEVWGLLDIVWPKPDLLILGLGPSMHPVAPETREHLNALGISVEVQDTRNAAAQFNLLATERGIGNVAAALVPIGWKEGR